MKGKLFVLLLCAFLALFLVVACDEAGLTNGETTDQPAVTDQDKIEEKVQVIYCPFVVSGASKGLSKFPDETPFVTEDMNVGSFDAAPYTNIPDEEMTKIINGARMWLACDALSAFPVLPEMQKYEQKPQEFIASAKAADLMLYGFPMKITNSKINDDGIYIRMIGYEGERDVVVADYYYNWDDKTFSYREIVLPFFGANGGNNIILFQLDDVPITEDENGDVSFVAGVKNGEIDASTDITMYYMHFPTIGASTMFQLEETHLIMDNDAGFVVATGYESCRSASTPFYADDNPKINEEAVSKNSAVRALHEFFLEHGEDYGESSYQAADEEYYGTIYRYIIDNDSCNLDFGYTVLDYMFDGIDEFKAMYPESNEDFNKLVFKPNTEAEKLFDDKELDSDLYYGVVFDMNKDADGKYRGSAFFHYYIDPYNSEYNSYIARNTEVIKDFGDGDGYYGEFYLNSFNELFPELFDDKSITTGKDFGRAFLSAFGLSENSIDAYMNKVKVSTP